MRIFDITFVFYFSTMLQTVRGMQDIFGEYQRYFTFLKKVARHEFRKNGFTRISTPVIEFEELITRSAGVKMALLVFLHQLLNLKNLLLDQLV